MSLPNAKHDRQAPAGMSFAGVSLGNAAPAARLSLLLTVFMGLCAALSACGSGGFAPLYAPSSVGGSLSTKLRQVQITTIPGRVGQRLRNELLFQTTGGGHEAAPKYRLDVTLTERIISTLINADGDSLSQTFILDANFQLIDIESTNVLVSGTSFGRAGFERVTSIFANVQARRDAENRAATTVARDIRSRMEAVLATSET